MIRLLCLFITFFYLNAQDKELSEAVDVANALFEQEKYQEAYDAYSKLIDTYPGNEYVWYNIGNAQFKLKNYQEARASYLRSFNFTDTLTLSKINYNIGNTYLFESKVDTAISYYKRALELNDQDKDAKWNLELAQAILKEKSKKQQQQQQNENKKNEPSEFAKKLFERAKKLVEEFKFKEASNLMNRGLKQDPTVQVYQSFIDKLTNVVKVLGAP